MTLKKTLVEYYSKRAKEYDDVYRHQDKTRVKEQKVLAEYITQTFKGRFVLELACGTAFWTKYLLKSAKKVLATDYSLNMLKIASSRVSKSANIILLQADAYNPPFSFPKFNGAMANFWFSHIPKKRMKKFLTILHSRLNKHSVVLMVDDVYRKGRGGELVQKAGQDTFKRRLLKSGERFDILKNYYSKSELEEIFSKYSKNLEVVYLTNFWIVKYYI